MGYDYANTGDEIVLADSGYIYDDTFEKVAKRVEWWAQLQMDKAVDALKAAFSVKDEVKVTGGRG